MFKKILVVFFGAVLSACAPPFSEEKEIAQNTHLFYGDQQLFSAAVTLTSSAQEDLGFEYNFMSEGASVEDGAQPFVPASLNKLFTIHWALSKLSPRFAYDTQISFERVSLNKIKNLTLQGDGDPTLGSQKWQSQLVVSPQSIVDRLIREGVQVVDGPISISTRDARWLQIRYPQGLDDEDKSTCYGAISQELNLRDNCASALIQGSQAIWSSPSVVDPIEFTLVPEALKKIHVVIDLSQRPSIWIQSSKNLNFKGTLNLPVFQIHGWFKNQILQEGLKRGIQFIHQNPILNHQSLETKNSHEHDFGPENKNEREVWHFSSPPLSELVRQIAKNSDNFAAEALFKTVSSRLLSDKQDLLSLSQREIQNFLHIQLKPSEADEIKVLDGSGLSQLNSITPRAYFAFLKSVKNAPTWKTFLNSLSVAGVDGTLETRFTHCVCKGFVRAKTGTLKGFFQLAGYIAQKQNDKNNRTDKNDIRDISDANEKLEWIPFVLLTKGTAAQKNKILKLHEDLVEKLYLQLNPPIVSSNKKRVN